MGHDSTLNCDPGSEFHVELWPRVRIPRWIVTPGHDSTLNCDPGSCFHLNFDPGSLFHVELWPQVMISRWILTPGQDSTLNFDPGSEFHVELWPRVMIPRWIMTPGPNFTLNCDPRSGSHFNVKFWSRVTIQRGILTRGHNSTWNSDPSTYLLPVELRLNKVSKFNGAIKIQQLGRVIIQRKIHWIVTPGRYSMGGSKFYLTPEYFFSESDCELRGILDDISVALDHQSVREKTGPISSKWWITSNETPWHLSYA